ncbi:unnamed protein product [Rotaria magnacalcarata]
MNFFNSISATRTDVGGYASSISSMKNGFSVYSMISRGIDHRIPDSYDPYDSNSIVRVIGHLIYSYAENKSRTTEDNTYIYIYIYERKRTHSFPVGLDDDDDARGGDGGGGCYYPPTMLLVLLFLSSSF